MADVTEQLRLRALLEAGISLTSELSLDAVLQRLVETAARLTGSRYAALGVIDPTGQGLERFLTFGVDEETQRTIGDPPRGRGILGVLIREAKPLRLHDLGQDPRSVGFPPGHPPMRTFLGVPILLRGVAFGNLYLTEKEDGEDFTEEDEEVALLLASQAAVAVENARLYESSTRWSRQLESLNEIGNALATEVELPSVLQLVAERLRELVDARLVLIALPSGDESLRLATAEGKGTEGLVGMPLGLETSKAGRVFLRKRSERIDSVVDDPRLGEAFAARAAIAVDLSERVTRDAIRRAVEAQELERRRLARELHDEIGQDLTSLLLGLKTIDEAGSGGKLKEATANMRELVVTALQDVRRLAVELRPKALDDFGLVPALERLASTFEEQTGMTVQLEDRLLGNRLPGEVETALYRIVQEALTNVVKHAHAQHVSILLTLKEGSVAAIIEDDGSGFDPGARTEGLGLIGIRERLDLLGGHLVIESTRAGTTLVAEVPLS